MGYELAGRGHLEVWFDNHADNLVACEHMATWVKAAQIDPLAVSDEVRVQPRTGRLMYVSRVPNTNAIVTYLVFDAPVRVLSIIKIIPALEAV